MQFHNGQLCKRHILQIREQLPNGQHGEQLLFHAYGLIVDLCLDTNLCTLSGVQRPLHFLQTNLITLRELIFLALHLLHLLEYQVQKYVDANEIDLVPLVQDVHREDLIHREIDADHMSRNYLCILCRET